MLSNSEIGKLGSRAESISTIQEVVLFVSINWLPPSTSGSIESVETVRIIGARFSASPLEKEIELRSEL